ncbi:MAG: hypothetical protein ACKVQU_36760 [Burkholderiales bacterium]
MQRGLARDATYRIEDHASAATKRVIGIHFSNLAVVLLAGYELPVVPIGASRRPTIDADTHVRCRYRGIAHVYRSCGGAYTSGDKQSAIAVAD